MKSEEDEERSRVLTSLFIRIYERVEHRKRGRERGEQRKEEELLKSRKCCGESEPRRYVGIGGPRRATPQGRGGHLQIILGFSTTRTLTRGWPGLLHMRGRPC